MCKKLFCLMAGTAILFAVALALPSSSLAQRQKPGTGVETKTQIEAIPGIMNKAAELQMEWQGINQGVQSLLRKLREDRAFATAWDKAATVNNKPELHSLVRSAGLTLGEVSVDTIGKGHIHIRIKTRWFTIDIDFSY
jgi:hypothetical protein